MSMPGASLATEAPKQADVIVVGNGALGLFLADELVERHIGSVVVVGPNARDGGASRAAGAMLGCFGEVTAETLRSDLGRARFEIGVAAHDYWPAALRRLGEHAPAAKPLQVATDTDVVVNTVSAELDSFNLHAMTAALDLYNKPWTEIDPGEIAGYRPRPDCRALRAIHLPGEGAVDARGVLRALETRLRLAGTPILDHTVRGLMTSNGVATGVELDDGTRVEAGVIVVAAGARSEELVRTASEQIELIPTFPGLGFAVIARRLAGPPFRSVVRTPNRGFACGLHVVPAGDGREYLGATNRLVDQATSAAWLGDVRYLTQYAMQQLDEEIARHHVEQFLSGNRPVTLDGFPLIGWLPISGLYLMTGTYRDGFHCAPLLATHVANELQGKPGMIDPRFKPVREPIVARTMEQSIDDYVQHNLAAWFETSAEAAPQMTTTQLANYYRVLVAQLYDELGIDYPLAPDVLWYAAGHMIGARRIARYLRRHNGKSPEPAQAAASAGIGVAQR